MSTTLLVTGIHREELAFGDRVAELIDSADIDIMRVPEGISHSKTGTDDDFYFATQHREIYLQLQQQIRKQHRLLIDLHCGENTNGLYAEMFSHSDHFIRCMTQEASEFREQNKIRLIKIIAEMDKPSYSNTHVVDRAHIQAKTWIPECIWNNSKFNYVGLEVYLADGKQGTAEDWGFTYKLINLIQACSGISNG